MIFLLNEVNYLYKGSALKAGSSYCVKIIKMVLPTRNGFTYRDENGVSEGMADMVFSDETVISNSLGLHARPASMIVKLASQFESEITLEKDGEAVSGKSIMGLLMLSAGHGSAIKITAVGPDGADALKALMELFDKKFHEE